jgi:hypothetical protein
VAVPAVTAISPVSGLSAGGSVVSITGTNMGTATAVHFGATDATAFANLSATQVVATAPAGTGTVHVTVTTAGGTSPTSAADYFAYSDGLFTVAEARAFDKRQLEDSESYSDAAIIAKEAEIRAFLTQACGVDFVSTVHTDEYQDGLGSGTLLLDWPLVSSVSAASTRSGTTWTALTSDELTMLQVFDTGEIWWDGGYWPHGRRNVKLTYAAGYATVPAEIKRAALLVAVTELPTSNVPFSADSYDAGGMSVSFAQGDGFNDNWSRIAEVRRAMRLYSRRLPGIA